MSDNDVAYRSLLWRDTCEARGHPTDVHPAQLSTDQREGASSASTAPWPTDGRTPAATNPIANAGTRWRRGCTTTTSSGPTQPAATSGPSHV
jgi:hypothetical protein